MLALCLSKGVVCLSSPGLGWRLGGCKANAAQCALAQTSGGYMDLKAPAAG